MMKRQRRIRGEEKGKEANFQKNPGNRKKNSYCETSVRDFIRPKCNKEKKWKIAKRKNNR